MKNEVSCIHTKSIFDYLREHNNGNCSCLIGDLDPEIDALPDPEGFLNDANNWVSVDVCSKLFERARLLLKDEMTAYRIAKFAVEHVSLGYFQKTFVKTFWSTKKALKNLQKINDKFNRNKKVELVELKRNGAVVRLHWAKNVLLKDFCWNNQGFYTFLPLVWGSKPLTLKEKHCFFKGDPYCEFHLKWPFRNRLHELFSRFFTSRSVLKETIVEMEADKKIISEKYEEVNRLNMKLNYKIKQLLAIQETGKAILSVLNLEHLLNVIINALSSVCQINRAIIMLVNEKEGWLEYIHGVGFSGEIPGEVKNYRVPLHHVNNILARVANTGVPEYIPDVKKSSLRKDNIMLTYGRPQSIYVVPLITRSKVVGVIATDAVSRKGVPKETRETLEIFAPQIAIAIENARLYQRLQEQMLELKESYALLSRADKFSFLGNLAAKLAHEIKNPMTAIGTFLQMLPHKFDDKEFREDFYNIALEETNRVNNLISELLDLVKTRESKFELNDLHELIDKMIFLVSPRSKAKKIEVVKRYDPIIGRIWLDSEKIKQVILNLLSNALEFTPRGGKIEILTMICTENQRQKSIRIEVKDNGIGISPSMIDKIFDPYFTTKHKSNMHNGTGLGLFIAHQNLEDHSGTIKVESTVHKGTTFILTIPSEGFLKDVKVEQA